MISSIRKLSWFIILVVVLFLSLGLMAYAWWLYKIESGTRAYKKGDLPAAAGIYAAAEEPFIQVPWLAHLVRKDYQKLIFDGVSILYGEGKDEEVIKKLEDAAAGFPYLGETGEFSFWMGNSLLRQAMRSKNPDASAGGLKAALAEYQRGLAAHPEDWDLKYNYELVRHTLSRRGLDKTEEDEDEEGGVKSLLDKMEPQKDKMDKQLPREKRG